MEETLPHRDLVLVGAGHTHMHIVRMWGMDPLPGVRLTLVSSHARATYSGMLPGTLAALYRREEMEIDLVRFVTSCRARLIVSPATGLDPVARRIHLTDRPAIRFDVASVGMGSIPVGRALWESAPHVLSVKPMPSFLDRLDAALDRLRREKGPGGTLHAVIIGAGAAGFEVALCLETRLRRDGGLAARVAMVDAGDGILRGYSPRTRELGRLELERRSIRFHGGSPVTEVPPGEVVLSDGRRLEADIVIWVTGAAPPPALDDFRLPRSADGFLAVDRRLRSIADPPVFVVGDTATLVESPVPKAGVYAVREGPILWENLRRTFHSLPLVEYQPQEGFLSILSTGDGRAIAEYKGFSFHTGWAWRLKDWIDRRFMKMFTPMPSMAAGPGAPQPMRCLGCGGKVGGRVLQEVLDRLVAEEAAGGRPGPLAAPEDAAILPPGGPVTDLTTVDFFRAFLEDPHLVGRIATLNALSDIYAMGGRPTGVLAMVALPLGTPRQHQEILYQVLSGSRRELAAAGVPLLGGHTIEARDLMVGFSVLGSMEGAAPLTKGGLRPGDKLVCTKPLGSGTLLAALGRNELGAAAYESLVAAMLQSNGAASRIALEHGVQAMTDVTGFGLAGHLAEMLEAARVDARLDLTAVRALPGAIACLESRIFSTLALANEEYASRVDLRFETVPGARRALLFDPQTGGGLLIGVAPARADGLLAALVARGYPDAAILGEVTGSCGERPILTLA